MSIVFLSVTIRARISAELRDEPERERQNSYSGKSPLQKNDTKEWETNYAENKLRSISFFCTNENGFIMDNKTILINK